MHGSMLSASDTSQFQCAEMWWMLVPLGQVLSEWGLLQVLTRYEVMPRSSPGVHLTSWRMTSGFRYIFVVDLNRCPIDRLLFYSLLQFVVILNNKPFIEPISGPLRLPFGLRWAATNVLPVFSELLPEVFSAVFRLMVNGGSAVSGAITIFW